MDKNPVSLDYVHSIMLDTMVDVWRNFLSHIPFLVTGVIVLLLTWLVSSLVVTIVRRLLLRARVRRSLQELLLRLVTIAVWILGLLLTAMVIFPGLTPSKAIGGLGLASIAIGFAFKEVFENFFAGILLLWRFPMEPGDYIECQGIMGRIENITVRMTTIRQVTGELTVVPNSFLFKNPLDILTGIPKRRVGIVVGIAYGEDIEQAVSVIEKSLENCETIAQDRPVQVFPQGFGESSVDIEVVWWTDPDPVDIRRSRGEVVTTIKKALDENNIEIPFPYRTLVFKEPLELKGS
ncbi:MAG TPA: mechanosensitive ion channel family protein [Gammaproteobacteria bacterium]|nr:mechanosensitive ion channel family protein [Gammaproteobacteria bacterium]